MVRRAFPMAALGVASILTLVGWAPVRGEDTRTSSQFVMGLRERRLYDIATEYLEQLRTAPDTPDDLRQTIDYEQALILLDDAAHSGDLTARKLMLDEARDKLAAFTKAFPNHPLASEALVQRARLLVERGHLSVLFGEETENKAEKEGKLIEARKSFDEARIAYGQAEEKLQATFKTFPPFIPEGDPRKQERDRAHTALMDSQLQKAIVDYEQGQTFLPNSPERKALLAKGQTAFEDLYKKYRTQFAGLAAQMWQAKCYEESGDPIDLNKAMGIYNMLLEHGDPRLRGLQRHVSYFKIIALAKRKEFALAADECVRWLQRYNAPEEKRSNEGIGVQFELAKNIMAQMPEITKDADKATAKRRVADLLGEVVRFSSPFKSEALKVLKEVKPSAAVRFEDVAKLNYEDAMGQADQAISAHEWTKAVALLKQAVRKLNPSKAPDKAILPRYNMAFCYYMNKDFYEAAVICEHLARRYPNSPLGSKATEIAMASYADAYNTFTEIDRGADLKNLTEMAEYTAATWPNTDQGDVAKMTLGQIYHGTGLYPKAIASFESIREKSSKWVEAMSRVGASHWMLSLRLRQNGDAKGADAEVEKAIAVLKASYKGRLDNGATLAEPGLVSNACDIADIYLDTGKPAEALALLDPIAKAQAPDAKGTLQGRLLSTMLRCHISNNQVDLAQTDMVALEKAGGGGTLTQLYFSLGKLIEKEMEKLKGRNDIAGLARMQQSYQKFLSALVAAKAGQTYDSLEWAGENMLKLNHAKDAADVFNTILKTYTADPKFLALPNANDLLLRTKLKLSNALRDQRDFGTADTLVSDLLKEHPKAIEPRIEEGLLLEAKALAGQGDWNASYSKWRSLALLLAGSRQKPLEYYDAWWHAGFALFKEGKTALAEQTLNSVKRLSPKLGGPEMQAKYADLLKQMKAKR
jgi:hypothetical protein